jgi:transglutaminase-like putative cysteine protease
MAELRWLLLAGGLLGQIGLVTGGLLPLAALPVFAGLLVGAWALGLRPDHTTTRWPVRLAFLVPVVLLGMAFHAQPQQLELLGFLLSVGQVSNALVWGPYHDRVRGQIAAAAALLLIGAAAGGALALAVLAVGSLVLLAATVLHSAQRWDRDAVGSAGALRRSGALRVTSVAVVAWLLSALLVPELTSARSAQDGGFPTAERSAAQLVQGVVDLRRRGELTERPLAAVYSPDQLWRSGDYSTWDGATWSNPETSSSPRRTMALSAQLLQDPSSPATRTDPVELLGSAGMVWSPGHAVEAAVMPSADGATVDASGAVQLPGATAYLVRSEPPVQDPEQLRHAGPGPADPRWLQLPDDLPERVRELARTITADAPTTYDKVQAVERWLETNASYSLDAPVPARGEDAVDRFLFEDRVGFCAQFAAAETVLLRAVGIPARFVVGLAYPEDVGGGRYVLREKNQHAWVEVSYAGLGWSASDPTAGAPTAPAAASAAQRLLRWAQDNAAWTALLALGLLVLAAVLRLVLRRRPGGERRRRGSVRQVAGEQDRPALAAFLRWNTGLGPAGRQPGESLRELRRRLDLSPSHADAVEVVERECYAPRPPEPGETAAAVAVLDPSAPAHAQQPESRIRRAGS